MGITVLLIDYWVKFEYEVIEELGMIIHMWEINPKQSNNLMSFYCGSYSIIWIKYIHLSNEIPRLTSMELTLSVV